MKQRIDFETGFSLVELAIVLVVVALLLGGLLVPLTMQIEQQKIRETQKAMDEIKEALIGYAIANNRLPCPDSDLDGLENPPTPTVALNTPVAGQTTQTFSCLVDEGGLPYQALGVSREDGWNNRFRYRVTPAFTQRTIVTDNATGNVLSSTAFTLGTPGNINVQSRGDNPATSPPTVESKFLLTLAANVPAAIISHGKNGYGATSSAGLSQAPVPASNADETTNAGMGTSKIIRPPTSSKADCSDTAEGKPFCEFDDLVTWLSPNILFNRMVAAGRLP
ncbi:MAG: prepilin-type cleavage/methylation domain-containing protein [Sulfurimicrobium sp.]|nr:prepilin-type cleavage/methylation domain-containing protein [Sulfurimicrobium sp.]